MKQDTMLERSPPLVQAAFNEATHQASADFPKSNPRHTKALAQ
ncbi:hypothetical protein WCE34_14220 [Luteimonas sp. MJ204]